MPTKAMAITITVIGGGAAGAMAAIAAHSLMPDAAIAVVEPRSTVGQGVAYSTNVRAHRLNSRSREMSVLPHVADDFVAWSRAVGQPTEPTEFASRVAYGRYVHDRLARTAPDVVHIQATVSRLVRSADATWAVALSNGTTFNTDVVVMAIGGPAPDVPLALRAVPAKLLVQDPWRAGWISKLPLDANVLFVGTGLTMVDVALSVAAQRPRAKLLALSRHGLVPTTHQTKPIPARPIAATPPTTARALLQWFRAAAQEAHADGGDDFGVVATVRSQAPEIWQSLDVSEQRRFHRHVAAYWNAYRHRMPPATARRIATLRASGRLDIKRGRMLSAHPSGERLTVRTLGQQGVTEIADVDRVVVCTGPSRDAARAPLAMSLIANGVWTPHASGDGIRITRDGRPIGRDGQPVADLFTVGWLRRGAELESTAIPELRAQAWAVAGAIAAARTEPG